MDGGFNNNHELIFKIAIRLMDGSALCYGRVGRKKNQIYRKFPNYFRASFEQFYVWSCILFKYWTIENGGKFPGNSRGYHPRLTAFVSRLKSMPWRKVWLHSYRSLTSQKLPKANKTKWKWREKCPKKQRENGGKFPEAKSFEIFQIFCANLKGFPFLILNSLWSWTKRGSSRAGAPLLCIYYFCCNQKWKESRKQSKTTFFFSLYCSSYSSKRHLGTASSSNAPREHIITRATLG